MQFYDNRLVNDPTALQRQLGKNIRKLRMGLGISQAALAERSELTVNYISHLEQGIKSPSLRTLASLATALGVKPFQLLYEPGTDLDIERERQLIRADLVEEVLESIRTGLAKDRQES